MFLVLYGVSVTLISFLISVERKKKKLCEVEDLQRTYVVRPVGVLSG